MNHYPPIAEHGLIGDLQTAALVSAWGEVNWWCTPRFDSPSVFAALLDARRGGSCRLAVDLPETEVTRRQLYVPDTAVLLTRFLAPGGIGEVADFLAPIPGPATDRHRLVRVVRVVRGRLPFAFSCRPRFDYARATHTLNRFSERAAVFHGPASDLHVQTTEPVDLLAEDGDLTARCVLAAGEAAVVTLTSVAGGGPAPRPPSRTDIAGEIEDCRDFWQSWLRASRYQGRWPDMVHRSAITLKLLTYAPTGAPIAAATMGLPEEIGGERNWDYRYTWIRDAALSVHALTDLGFTAEARAFRHWIRDRIAVQATTSGEPLQIMYRVDGDPQVTEEVLPHLSGYLDSAPVRLGNAAADQLQLDIYGEAIGALSQEDIGELRGWRALTGVLDWLVDHWNRPDEGIWESRGGRQPHTFSRLMTWVAFDRALRLAARHSRPADLPRWLGARDEVFEQIIAHGYHADRQAFVQHYHTDKLDAALLLLPRTGFLSPKDPLWLNTLDAMEQDLVADSLVHRYNPATTPDGITGAEGTFTLCSFLYVDALARAGRLAQARYVFDKMLTYANHTGLYAEEIGPTGAQLGNFPQAFTHLALITAAQTLDAQLGR